MPDILIGDHVEVRGCDVWGPNGLAMVMEEKAWGYLGRCFGGIESGATGALFSP